MGEAFLQGLRDLGYVPDRTIMIERRCYVSDDESRRILSEFIRTGVDLIVALGSDAVVSAHRATSTIPIVMLHSDPLGAGLVKSLARPGGHLTGMSFNAGPEVGAKRLELLTQ